MLVGLSVSGCCLLDTYLGMILSFMLSIFIFDWASGVLLSDPICVTSVEVDEFFVSETQFHPMLQLIHVVLSYVSVDDVHPWHNVLWELIYSMSNYKFYCSTLMIFRILHQACLFFTKRCCQLQPNPFLLLLLWYP